MIISQEWAMPNKDTFKIAPINKLLHRYTDYFDEEILDPFSNDDRVGAMNLYELGKQYLNGDLKPKFTKTNVTD